MSDLERLGWLDQGLAPVEVASRRVRLHHRASFGVMRAAAGRRRRIPK
jgi:hypothetical protein